MMITWWNIAIYCDNNRLPKSLYKSSLYYMVHNKRKNYTWIEGASPLMEEKMTLNVCENLFAKLENNRISWRKKIKWKKKIKISWQQQLQSVDDDWIQKKP